MFHFYIPRKQKTGGFLMFSGVQKWNIGWRWVNLQFSGNSIGAWLCKWFVEYVIVRTENHIQQFEYILQCFKGGEKNNIEETTVHSLFASGYETKVSHMAIHFFRIFSRLKV